MKTETLHTDTFDHHGHTITLDWFQDTSHGAPWECGDGHGPVSNWTHRDKRPGERVLCQDGGSKRFYDYAAAITKAKLEGWDAPPYGEGTIGERANRAVDADFKLLKDWCDGKWYFVGYLGAITAPDDTELTCLDLSFWGIDSPSMGYFRDEAFEIAREYIDRETSAANDAACRDIVTV